MKIKNKSLRDIFIKGNKRNNQLQKNNTLNLILQGYSNFIFLFLIQGIISSVIREYQFRRNITEILKNVNINSMYVIEKMTKIQYIEDSIALSIIIIVSMIMLYWYSYKFKAVGECSG